MCNQIYSQKRERTQILHTRNHKRNEDLRRYDTVPSKNKKQLRNSEFSESVKNYSKISKINM